MRARISGGQVRLLEAGLTPRFYTPPWNAIDPGLPVALAQLGVPVLSAGATWIGQPGVHYLSAEIDLLSWKRGQRFKGTLRVLPALRRALAVRRVTGAYGRPIGLLTHHLVHDAATWRFLDLALPWLDRRFEWVGVDVSDAATSRQVIRAEGPVSAGMAKPLAV